MNRLGTHLFVAATWLAAAGVAHADAVTDWNQRAGGFIGDARMGTPPAVRVMALVQTAVLDGVLAVTGKGTSVQSEAVSVSVQAAVAAANRATLLPLLPTQAAAIEAAYGAALAGLPEGPAKAAGLQAGERAAAAVFAQRAEDKVGTAESYRPHTTAGVYVPTSAVAVPQWPARKPWIMSTASQFRPGPPPSLESAAWQRDYAEVKSLGSRTSTVRTAEQTEIGQFWDYSLPPVYYGVVRSVALMPGRDAVANAWLYAIVAQGMDDAMIAVLDAKYHYNFWRPVTAIRNADLDGNAATDRDAGWVSLIEAPLHPEYPSAHSILAATVGTILQSEVGRQPVQLSTSSPTAKGATRRWSAIEDFIQEVGMSRVYGGIHYRFSNEAGIAMGRKLAGQALDRRAGAR
ncbi:MAG: vanadium-dependent haloperoxidase [Burkholderiales bacterium]|jgi:hypothetical protein